MIVNEPNSHIVILRNWTLCKRQEKALAMTNPIPLRRVHRVNGSRSDIRDHQLAREKGTRLLVFASVSIALGERIYHDDATCKYDCRVSLP